LPKSNFSKFYIRVLILTKELLELPIKFEEFRSEVNRRFEALEMEEILERHEKSIQELKGWQLEHKVFINICSYLGSYIGIRKEM